MAKKMLAVTIFEVLVKKLNMLAAETSRKKSYFVNQAIREYIEEIEDYELALQRRGGESVTLTRVKEKLEL